MPLRSLPTWLLSSCLVLVWLSLADRLSAEMCDVARLKCAYRTGCGMALHNYMFECADVMSGRTARCSDMCTKSLIALSSTEEGQVLVKCDCGEDDFCSEAKRRVEVCRPAVVKAMRNSSVVTCSIAHWICAADELCSTALAFYHRFCRKMMDGRKCSARCINSIDILNRQEKASKLRTCVCDGSEDYDCERIKHNMDFLCFKKIAHATKTTRVTTVKGQSVSFNAQLQMNGKVYLLLIIVGFMFT